MIVSVCVMFCRHLTGAPFERLFCEDFNGDFCLKGGKYSPRYLYQKNWVATCMRNG